MRVRHNLPQHQILQDPLANIRYIGKHDKQNTIEAFKDGGEGTILRACIAPGEGMPLRALGYYATLEHLNRVYFPKAEAQLVLAINTADRVNGQLENGSRYESAQQFIEHTVFLPPHPQATKRPLLLFDNDDVPPINTHRLGDVLHNTAAGEKLKQQANRRSADHLSYLAAHIVMHDTVQCVHSVDYGAPKPAQTARRIISVGGKAEETFYEARFRASKHGICIPEQVEQTGQLFTRNDTVPVYQFARQPHEGERLFDPSIADPLELRSSILSDEFRVGTNSLLRDLVHVRDYVDAVTMAITAFTEA
jgi:hypothetical protein